MTIEPYEMAQQQRQRQDEHQISQAGNADDETSVDNLPPLEPKTPEQIDAMTIKEREEYMQRAIKVHKKDLDKMFARMSKDRPADSSS
eukprot:CAMPEP_0116825504 /NCGR_PEP_ID=MMETSP0418-20121206/2002_1 /TAXON_ID=1158023 /ORGANISM="Astrosyne radiata, Strain 13vi08-1A" /LENGTH=87 /DNA_ID=CAMNT_0004454019 /DNA_START=11 /DNA_END=274 /DNA_ORIENTATION=+